jgi:4-hydroxy-tetrahydrodipicolinate synthase
LTGEDAFFYSTLLLGGDGGILASSHIRTEDFVQVFKSIKNNDHLMALEAWKPLYKIIPLLFEEPNPTPIKYYLRKHELINSSEVRLPLVDITDNLKAKMDLV